jgi:LmbE family N-acetylglucosaminyl deacetylase
MPRLTPAALAMLLFFAPAISRSQQAGTRTLVAVLAHDDDEDPAGPVLARYAREGVQVYLLIATDGGQGTGFAAARGATVPPEPELARMRTEEAQCAARAIGAKTPILLNFPEGKLGDYIGDRSLTYRLTDRIAMELQRLHPDVIVTWGPEGRAPGVPDRVFFMYIPAAGIQAMNPQRGVPPLVLPDARYVTVHVPFTPEDLQAATRSMTCHRSQFTPEIVQRVEAASARVWNGAIPFVPAFPTAPLSDLFR